MFNNFGWLAGQKPLDDKNIAESASGNHVPPPSSSFIDPTSSTQGARPPLIRRSTLPSDAERPPEAQRQRTTTDTIAALVSPSPHDDIVSGIKNRIAEIATLNNPPTSITYADSSIPDGAEGKKPLRARIPEHMYDPFSGQNIGLLSPGDIDDKHDELWTHLSKIHALQSEIAAMHAQMENLGTGERPTRVERSVDDEADNPEETAKVAKDAEFVKLADRFTGRKEQIDRLMSKLNELSKAINNFHATRTPFFHLKDPTPRTYEDNQAAASSSAEQTMAPGSFGLSIVTGEPTSST